MEAYKVDARGRSCPEPVVMTQKAIKSTATFIEVIVDNTVARDNVCRFAENYGYRTESREDGEDIVLSLKK